MKIIGYQDELDELINNSDFDFKKVKIKVLERGSITDAELDAFGKFTEYEKKIIKEEYSKHYKGFFPNPYCALR